MPAAFAAKRNALIAAEKLGSEGDLDCDALERLVKAYERVIEDEDDVLSENPMEQLEAAAHAVFRSWMSERARTYRRLQHFDDLQGTAVTVQAMVFGNGGLSSGAGVAFSRDPSTGAAVPVIDVLFDSQGEDVVSGSHNPETEDAIARALPDVAAQLREALQRLEQDFGDMQDVEFTIENGKLWMLQTRAAKRTPQAALRLAIDFVNEGRITPAEALQRLDGVDLATLTKQKLVIADAPVAHGTGAHRRHRRRPRGVRSGQRGAPGGERRAGHSGASRYDDGRCRRLCRVEGHRDGGRRPDRPCGAGRAAIGRTLHRRLHRARRRCRRPLPRGWRRRPSRKAIGCRSTARAARSISAKAASSPSGRRPSSPKSKRWRQSLRSATSSTS